MAKADEPDKPICEDREEAERGGWQRVEGVIVEKPFDSAEWLKRRPLYEDELPPQHEGETDEDYNARLIASGIFD